MPRNNRMAATHGTKMDEWTPLVKASLESKFGDKTDALCALLVETGSLISGGSILAACIGEPVLKQDTDIYVPVKHIPHFLTTFVHNDSAIFKPTKWNSFGASFYCKSFLRKNGIRKVYNFADTVKQPADWVPVVMEKVQLADTYVQKADDERCLGGVEDEEEGTVIKVMGQMARVLYGSDPTGSSLAKSWYHFDEIQMARLEQNNEVDIMAVRNKRGPLAVVNNFDLTFCQVWFDGSDVYASHPDHIKAKKGELRYEYCLTLMGGNRFLKKRIAKYMDRGFTINPDAALVNDGFLKKLIGLIGSNQSRTKCTTDLIPGDRFDIPEFKQSWFNRIAMRYFLGVRNGIESDSGAECLSIPLQNEVLSNQLALLDKDKMLTVRYWDKVTFGKRFKPLGFGLFKLQLDDGYDSDDMTTDELKRIAVEKYTGEAADPDLVYYRSCTNLVLNSKVKQIRKGGAGATLAAIGGVPGRFADKANKLLGIIEDFALRTGDDMFGNSAKLYDIHEHDVDQGITSESLESYLESTMTGDDYDVKCYAAGGGGYAGCTKKLLLKEIEYIVSPEFYKRYSAERPKKAGLDQNVENFDNVLRNIKSYDPGWGDIYHSTMCPYCLSFDERGSGCSVMTHVNIKGVEGETPYCPKEKQVAEILSKYKVAGAALDGGFVRLEWCVDCGCPGSGHKHFSHDMTRMIEHPKIPDPKYPGQTKYDYGTCPGGGRPELIARMLAVRDIYRRRNIRDPKEERKQAALAADKAPLNAGLMARARAIWDAAQPGITWRNKKQDALVAAEKAAAGKTLQEVRDAKEAASKAFMAANPMPPDVDFDVPIPKSKKYNDPLYERDGVEDNVDYQRWLNGPEPVTATAAEPAYMTQAKARATEALPDVPANAAQSNWNKDMIVFLRKFIEQPLHKAYLLDKMGADRFERLQTLFAAGLSTHVNDNAEVIDLNLVEAFVLYILTVMLPPPALALPGGKESKQFALAQVLGGDRVKNQLDAMQISPAELSSIKIVFKDSLLNYFIAEHFRQAQGAQGGSRKKRGKTARQVNRRKTRKLIQ